MSFLSIHESDDPFKLRDRSSKLKQDLPSVITNDVDFTPNTVFDEVRGQRESITSTPVNESPLHLDKVENEPLNLEFNPDAGCEISLNDNKHVTCLEEHLRNTADDNELLEQVDEVGKSMRELLNVSETHKIQTEEEQMTDKLSDDDF